MGEGTRLVMARLVEAARLGTLRVALILLAVSLPLALDSQLEPAGEDHALPAVVQEEIETADVPAFATHRLYCLKIVSAPDPRFPPYARLAAFMGLGRPAEGANAGALTSAEVAPRLLSAPSPARAPPQAGGQDGSGAFG